MQALQTGPAGEPWRGDATTIAVVGIAHGTSHFHHLLLAPLFPWFAAHYGLAYTELGLLVTLFFVVSGIGQALAGFVVDRFGARPVLHAALVCFALASLSAALVDGYRGLVAASVLAGLGNSPFHPIDFSILNRRVRPARLGHAFSVHGVSGNLGWALAPLVLTSLFAATGSLRLTYLCMASVSLAVLALVWLARDALDDRAGTAHATQAAATGQAPGVTASAPAPADARAAPPDAGAEAHALAFLRLPSVWLCFAFLFFSTCTLAGIQNFGGPVLHHLAGLSLETAGLVVTGYMVLSAAGTLSGGFLAGRAVPAERLISAALLGSATLLLLAATGWITGLPALLIVSAAGFGIGFAAPARDLLIRRAAPPGATGRVYGLVYSGLDLGFAVAAPLFGRLLDAGYSASILVGAALSLGCAVASAWWITHPARQSAALPSTKALGTSR